MFTWLQFCTHNLLHGPKQVMKLPVKARPLMYKEGGSSNPLNSCVHTSMLQAMHNTYGTCMRHLSQTRAVPPDPSAVVFRGFRREAHSTRSIIVTRLRHMSPSSINRSGSLGEEWSATITSRTRKRRFGRGTIATIRDGTLLLLN